MEKLRIDPEFRDKIPPLTEAEYEQLRENILNDGEVYEPIITWQNAIVDGHNRWRIICENWEILKDKYRIKEMDFADKWAAFDWMYKKQLGRRNLTEQQREVLIGLLYKARKNTQGGDRRSAEFSSVQNANLNGRTPRTNEILGKELGINPSTVVRAEHFADGVERIREVSSEAASKIMSGEAKVAKAIVRSVPTMRTDEVETLAHAILGGEKSKVESVGKRIRETKESQDVTKAIIADMSDLSTLPEFTIDYLLEDIDANGMEYVSLLRNTLIDRSTLLTEENRPSIAEAIDKIITEIQKVKELVKT